MKCTAIFQAIYVVAFFVFVVASAVAGKLPVALPYFYLTASCFAFVAYAVDKSAAKNGRWRIRESTLHFFALAGGWPGAFVAQRLLRHKSRKMPFQILFWATVALNSAAFGWFVWGFSGERPF